MKKNVIESQSQKLVEVDNISFLNNIEPNDSQYFKWVGGTNGSGAPQLANRIKNGTQVARRAIFSQYYGVQLPQNQKNFIKVILGKDVMGNKYPKDDVNPLHNYLLDTRSGDILDVSAMTHFRARNEIANFIV